MTVFDDSIKLHRENGGKLELNSKVSLNNKDDLSLAYTPGVAGVCEAIHKKPSEVHHLTLKKNMVAIVSDGSAVLGLGNIGAEASIPVMEGKAILFKEYAGLDAFPICIKSQDTQEIINIVKNITPVFGGINLEDISAPRCFEIEKALEDIGIPVFHDDQHGTAIVTLAALINACKLVNKPLNSVKIVINGAGAAGSAITDLIQLYVSHHFEASSSDIIICDSKGIISLTRPDIETQPAKKDLANKTNIQQVNGSLSNALNEADIFIGVSVANAVSKDMVRSMNNDPIVLAMSNPIPEIMPEDAKAAGAAIIGTGRSDFPNQVNNVLAFPGIFRGAIDAKAPKITDEMKLAAAEALANAVTNPTPDLIIPTVLDKNVGYQVAKSVENAFKQPHTI